METKSKLTESSAVPLAYEVERTRKELDSVSAHNKWLEGELQERNQQLALEKQKHSEQVLELSQKLDVTIMERDEFQSTATSLKQSEHNLRSKMEQLSQELREAKQEAANIKESSQQELQEERHLVELQKEQLDRLAHRHDRIAEENKSLRELANQASQASQREADEVRLAIEEENQKIITEQADLHKRQIDLLKAQLEDANRRRKEVEEEFMSTPHPRLGAPDRPTPMQDDEEPIGLTQLLQQLAQTQDALRKEQTERKRLSLFNQKIMADVHAQTPKFLRQRAEYEQALIDKEEWRSRLEGALAELASVRQDLKDASIEKGELHKQNRELQQETTDLAKQVQALLVSRSGGEADSEIPITVQEIQTQNQQLLQEHRRLSNIISELEDKLRSDTLQKRLEAAEEEVATLRENEEKQRASVTGIVEQRDLYRAIVAKQSNALADELTEPVAALGEKNKALHLRNSELETSIAKARTEIDGLSRDKETLEHRVARYEAHTTELTSSINKLQAQLSSAVASVARTEADASYHSEKCLRLEEAVQQSRSEVQRMQTALNQMRSVNDNLQKTVAAANVEASKWEQEYRQVSLRGTHDACFSKCSALTSNAYFRLE